MKTQLQSRLYQTALGVGAFAAAGMASAADVDVSAVVTAIQGAAVPIATIGAAILVVKVGIHVYKWVGRALNV